MKYDIAFKLWLSGLTMEAKDTLILINIDIVVEFVWN